MDRGAASIVRGVGIAALLFGVAGCDTTRGDLRRELEQATPTEHALKDLRFEETRIGEEYEFDITTSSPVFDFPAGKSYYLAVELPKASRAYDLVLKSVFLSSHSHEFSFHVVYPMTFGGRFDGESRWLSYRRRPFVFLPHVVTLDENFATVRLFGAEAFHIATDLHPVGISFLSLPVGDTWLETSIPFEPDSKERHAVILTIPALLDSQTRLPRDSSSGPYGEYWPWCRNDWILRALGYCDFAFHSPLGRLEMSFAYP